MGVEDNVIVPIRNRAECEATILIDEKRYTLAELRNGKFHEAIYDPNKDKVYRLCFKMLQNKADAEDMSQETFLKVYRNLHQFRGESLFSTWIYQITFNACLNLRKHRARKEREDHFETELELEEIAALNHHCDYKTENPEEAVTLADNKVMAHSLLNEAMGSIKEDYREVVIASIGTTYKEAAETLGLKLNTYKARLCRAKKMLKEKITEMGHSYQHEQNN